MTIDNLTIYYLLYAFKERVPWKIWQNESKSEAPYLAFTPLNEITKWNYDYKFGGKFLKFWFVKQFVKWIILFSIVRKINLLNELNIWNFFLKGKSVSIESMDYKTQKDFFTFVSHTFYISTKCYHLSSQAHELSMHKHDHLGYTPFTNK